MNEAQELAVTLAGTTSGGCVAYVAAAATSRTERVGNACQATARAYVRLAYCPHTDRDERCPDPDRCERHEYDVRLCPAHEVLVREWVSYVESEPIGGVS